MTTLIKLGQKGSVTPREGPFQVFGIDRECHDQKKRSMIQQTHDTHNRSGGVFLNHLEHRPFQHLDHDLAHPGRVWYTRGTFFSFAMENL